MTKSRAAKRKRAQAASQDFAKKRHKIGKAKPERDNQTSVAFRSRAIVLPEQKAFSETREDEDVLSVRRLSLDDLLGQTRHPSRRVRQDAFTGLRELLTGQDEMLGRSLADVVGQACAGVSDEGELVRYNAKLLLALCAGRRPRQFRAFFPLFSLTLASAFSHFNSGVRLSAARCLEAVFLAFRGMRAEQCELAASIFEHAPPLIANSGQLPAPKRLEVFRALHLALSVLHSQNSGELALQELAVSAGLLRRACQNFSFANLSPEASMLGVFLSSGACHSSGADASRPSEPAAALNLADVGEAFPVLLETWFEIDSGSSLVDSARRAEMMSVVVSLAFDLQALYASGGRADIARRKHLRQLLDNLAARFPLTLDAEGGSVGRNRSVLHSAVISLNFSVARLLVSGTVWDSTGLPVPLLQAVVEFAADVMNTRDLDGEAETSLIALLQEVWPIAMDENDRQSLVLEVLTCFKTLPPRATLKRSLLLFLGSAFHLQGRAVWLEGAETEFLRGLPDVVMSIASSGAPVKAVESAEVALRYVLTAVKRGYCEPIVFQRLLELFGLGKANSPAALAVLPLPLQADAVSAFAYAATPLESTWVSVFARFCVSSSATHHAEYVDVMRTIARVVWLVQRCASAEDALSFALTLYAKLGARGDQTTSAMRSLAGARLALAATVTAQPDASKYFLPQIANVFPTDWRDFSLMSALLCVESVCAALASHARGCGGCEPQAGDRWIPAREVVISAGVHILYSLGSFEGHLRKLDLESLGVLRELARAVPAALADVLRHLLDEVNDGIPRLLPAVLQEFLIGRDRLPVDVVINVRPLIEELLAAAEKFGDVEGPARLRAGLAVVESISSPP